MRGWVGASTGERDRKGDGREDGYATYVGTPLIAREARCATRQPLETRVAFGGLVPTSYSCDCTHPRRACLAAAHITCSRWRVSNITSNPTPRLTITQTRGCQHEGGQVDASRNIHKLSSACSQLSLRKPARYAHMVPTMASHRPFLPFVALLTLLVTSLLIAPSTACRCPPLSLEAYYERASTVVAATVFSVSSPTCPASHPDCPPSAQRISYFLAVSALYKGCAPLSLLLFADTSVSSSECGITLGNGETWLLFLGEPRAGTGLMQVFPIDTCQGNRLLESVSMEEKAFLSAEAAEAENGCLQPSPE